MGSKADEKRKEGPSLIINHNLPTIWADNFHISIREDKLCFFRVEAQLPEGLVEQARIMLGFEHFKKFLDVGCKTSGYYPEKEQKKISSPPKTKRTIRIAKTKKVPIKSK